MRPQIVKLSVRNSAASSGKKMHTQALALRLPCTLYHTLLLCMYVCVWNGNVTLAWLCMCLLCVARSMAAGNKTTNIAITGAALAAGVIALANGTIALWGEYTPSTPLTSPPILLSIEQKPRCRKKLFLTSL
jgi:hypothetical protein